MRTHIKIGFDKVHSMLIFNCSFSVWGSIFVSTNLGSIWPPGGVHTNGASVASSSGWTSGVGGNSGWSSGGGGAPASNAWTSGGVGGGGWTSSSSSGWD